MERAAAPGLTFTLQPGMTKARLVPAEPRLEAQLCAAGRRISHPSSPLVTELRKLCWGVRRAVSGRAQRALCELPRFPPTFFLPLGGRCCSPQADGCSAAASLPLRILSCLLLLPAEPAVPGRLSPPPTAVRHRSLSPRRFSFFLFYFKAAAPAPFS